MMRTFRGAAGIEFVIAITIFLSAFWFIYLQSAFMLTPQLQRNDIREPAVQYYANLLVSDAGIPVEWTSNPNLTAFAEYGTPNILNKTKLDWAATQNCSEIDSGMAGMDFAFRVTSPAGSWECANPPAKQGSVKRGAYVHSGDDYYPAVLEVWGA